MKSNVFSPKTGSLQGIVRDEVIAKPLLLALVEISELNGAVIATVNTDEEGRYALTSLKEGDYILKVSAPLHKPESKNVKIYPKTASTLNFNLLPEEQKPPASVVQAEVSPAATTQYYPPVTPTYQAPPQNDLELPYTQRSFPRSFSNAQRQLARRRQSLYDTSNSDSSVPQQQTSFNTVLTQAAGELIQGWINKKKEGSSSPQ